jgi:hypothetical protein
LIDWDGCCECMNKIAYHARVAARPNLAAYFASGRRPAAINGNGKGQPAAAK